MCKIFISDLHLEENRPEITQGFINFLQNKAVETEALYILGDFFEFWIGDDDPSPFANRIRDALSAATKKGLPIYLQHGNRDFLLKKKFFKSTGCIFLPEEVVIDLYGTPTLLMHGDTLCVDDIAYLKARKYVRNWLVQTLFLWKSLEKRQAIVSGYRKASKQHTATAPDYIMDAAQSEIEKKMLLHKVQHLIHGHTHRPGQHAFELNQLPASRTVLGAWHDKGNALYCHPDGRQQLVDIAF